MLESEARGKWCDRASVIWKTSSGITSYNRNDHGGPAKGTECIASKCMRWIPQEVWKNDKGIEVMAKPSGECTLLSEGYCAYNSGF